MIWGTPVFANTYIYIYVQISIRFRRIDPPNHSMHAEIVRGHIFPKPENRIFRPGDQIFDESWPEYGSGLFTPLHSNMSSEQPVVMSLMQ